MKVAAKISALLVFVGLMSFATLASAQYAPPPPPPPPGSGPSVAPPPPPPTTAPAPAPYRCGVPLAPCAQPAPVYYRPPPRRYNRPRFFRLGPYVGVGSGGFGILGARGPYEYITPGAFGSIYVGMNFSRRLALEIAFIGSGHNEQFSSEYDSTYGYDSNSMLLWGVTLDAKYNLIRPGWRSRFVPYLQAGVGAYGLVGEVVDSWGMTDQQSLASGGGFQLGGGVDIYLARWLTLGARVLYRGIVLGKLECGSSGDRCVSSDENTRTYINGLTGELNLSIVF